MVSPPDDPDPGSWDGFPTWIETVGLMICAVSGGGFVMTGLIELAVDAQGGREALAISGAAFGIGTLPLLPRLIITAYTIFKEHLRRRR
jgi:hypothetical protein